ncbi:pentatricopeptide repeat-containing protein At3g12770-like [Selaginella moellendorffii]|uniref:pentatricopeptide repeat-containing protein At3g12770-like n=1 Tax=Selaginella moellendorffii TaxID=88036 RepID=UPI000D1C855F|nr:pentatricopeptide repeat-containing protein At3g12770-like [Selaginella moellendorffii]|eukprot:XP_024522687.1 pentatricopeptide repeat-containing protein At3g12770-like [Selaginella moellendorffii]
MASAGERSSPAQAIAPRHKNHSAVQFVAAIKRCGKSQDLEAGQSLHRQALLAGFHSNRFVAAALITMYGKCQSMALAKEIFDGMIHGERDVVAWNSLILGFVENGESSVAMELFGEMDCEPSSHAYVAAIKACSCLAAQHLRLSLETGIGIHDRVKARGLDCDLVVATSLVGLYGKCGRMDLARGVFGGMIQRDVVAWNSMILGYAENGEGSRALEVFAAMDCEPSAVTFMAAIKACLSILFSCSEEGSKRGICLERGIAIHKMASEKFGSENLDVALATSLIDFYSKCGSLERARDVFHGMIWKNVVTWNSMIFGCIENGKSLLAMELFDSMDCAPTFVTYIAALKACSCLGSGETRSNKQLWLRRGILIHQRVRECGMDSSMAVANTLVDMYCKCGSLEFATKIFYGMTQRDVVTWNCLILGCVENGSYSKAMDLFTKMDCERDSFTYVAAFKACGGLASEEFNRDFYLREGISLHKKVSELGFDSNLVVLTTLLDMYKSCGNMLLAREVFDGLRKRDVVTWTTMILGYVESGGNLEALELFSRMDCEPDPYAFAAALKACEGFSRREECLDKVVTIHKQAERCGLESNTVVATSLVSVYSKCGKMEIARLVFDEMIQRDVLAWTSLILGYAKNGQSLIALELFATMNCEPDPLTYAASLEACGNLAMAGLAAGKYIHARTCKLGLEEDNVIAASLMNFYAKCGSISKAQELFDSVKSPNVVLWNTLIAGYSSAGDPFRVLHLAREMKDAGIGMDGITLVSILTTCSHAGLLEQGALCFESMVKCGVKTSVEHYSCLVDMFGRANRLEEALTLIQTMPMEASGSMWRSLLGACRNWKNVKVGEVAFQALVSARETKSADYVLMSDLYASSSIK